MGVSLIVVHYETREPLTRLLQSLRAARPQAVREIIVVNNSGEPIDDLVVGSGWRTRVLSPVPRRSQPTRSNRPWRMTSSRSPSFFTLSSEPPGPPGFQNREPMRRSGWLARWRITASVILRPCG